MENVNILDQMKPGDVVLEQKLSEDIIMEQKIAQMTNLVLPEHFIPNIAVKINDQILDLQSAADPNIVLTDAIRRRMHGTRARRLGFIMRVAEMAHFHLQLAPREWSLTFYDKLINQIKQLRGLESLTAALDRLVKDMLLITDTDAYRMALEYYASVQAAARLHDPIAMEVYSVLHEFFRLRRSALGEEPTEAEIKRDVNALLHGKKDGTVVVEGHARREIGAEHAAFDNTHVEHAAFKETIHEEGICPSCGSKNVENANFCHICGKNLH